MLAVKSETYTKIEIAADHPRIGDPGIKNLGTGGANCTRICMLGGSTKRVLISRENGHPCLVQSFHAGTPIIGSMKFQN